MTINKFLGRQSVQLKEGRLVDVPNERVGVGAQRRQPLHAQVHLGAGEEQGGHSPVGGQLRLPRLPLVAEDATQLLVLKQVRRAWIHQLVEGLVQLPVLVLHVGHLEEVVVGQLLAASVQLVRKVVPFFDDEETHPEEEEEKEAEKLDPGEDSADMLDPPFSVFSRTFPRLEPYRIKNELKIAAAPLLLLLPYVTFVFAASASAVVVLAPPGAQPQFTNLNNALINGQRKVLQPGKESVYGQVRQVVVGVGDGGQRQRAHRGQLKGGLQRSPVEGARK
ncbi:hypothetical protein TYRP_011747 [Tyrophagus putrescentiae]|nr:hypothetical protein TYRP_011747 [Tyrophagus putrescentiae]